MYYHSLPVICLSAHLEGSGGGHGESRQLSRGRPCGYQFTQGREIESGGRKVRGFPKLDRALRICLTLTQKKPAVRSRGEGEVVTVRLNDGKQTEETGGTESGGIPAKSDPPKIRPKR